jgi:phage gp36-like protein
MFVTKADLSSSIYPEILQMITRYTDAIINMKLSTAESEIETYLAGRYNIRAELDKTGDARHGYLLSLAIDMAIYHLYSLQESIPDHRTKRYEQAIAILKLIMGGKTPLAGVELAPEPETPPTGGSIAWGGSPPRARLV